MTRPVQETIPAGYFESLAKLRKPKEWDQLGLIEDARAIVKREDECSFGMGHVLAVIDHLQDNQRNDLIESLRCLFRYDVISGEYNRSGHGEQSPEGDWVKWEDVLEIIESSR